jgi:hypothetical protein
MQDMLVKIERMRCFMHKQGMLKGIRHPEVLKISRELDMLLNEYYKLLKAV